MPKPQNNRAQRRHPAEPAATKRPGFRVQKNVVSPVEGDPDGPHHDVFAGYLTGDSVTQSFHRSLMNLIGYDISGSRRLHSWASGRSGTLMLPETRNAIVQQMLDTDADWLFMVDADMGFDQNTLDRMLAVAHPTERPVIGALCFMQRELGGDDMGGMVMYPTPTILNWVEREIDGQTIHRFEGRDHYPVNRMIQVGATGAACILMHRNALEAIGGDWFTLKPGEDGVNQGEDISFCDRLRELGIPVWLHTGIRTTHYKHFWLSETDFWNSRIADVPTEHVDIIVPTLPGRLENVERLMRSLTASTGLARAWYVCDPEDTEKVKLVESLGGWTLLHAGTFAEKVNHAYRHGLSKAPWVMLVGDDVSFRPGWLDQALDVANRWKADVVGTNDLTNPRVMRGEHATHPLIRRRYVDEVGASWDDPGIVCHEGYGHCFVDDEIVLAAMQRNVFQAALGSHVPHHHPMSGNVAPDDIYRKGQKSLHADQELFKTRMQELSGIFPPKVMAAV